MIRALAVVVFISAFLSHTDLVASFNFEIVRSVIPYLQYLRKFKVEAMKEGSSTQAEVIIDNVIKEYAKYEHVRLPDQPDVQEMCDRIDHDAQHCRLFMEVVGEDGRFDQWKEGCDVHRTAITSDPIVGNKAIARIGCSSSAPPVTTASHFRAMIYLGELAEARDELLKENGDGESSKPRGKRIEQAIVELVNNANSMQNKRIPDAEEILAVCEIIDSEVETCKPYVIIVHRSSNRYKMWQDGCRIYQWHVGPKRIRKRHE